MKKPSNVIAAELPDLQRVQRIAVTCDFLRTTLEAGVVRSTSLHNLEWLLRLTGLREIARGAGLALDLVSPPSEPAAWARALGSQSRVRDYGADPFGTWAALYDDDQAQVFRDEHQRLKDADLVVGFELPRGLRRWLHAQGTRYLSLSVHPLRFLRDLCLAAKTNSPRLAALVGQTSVPPEEVTARARWLRALFAHARHPAHAMPEGIPLLAGQTAQDSVLINRGRFEGWTEHVEALEAQLSAHPVIGVLPHPHRPHPSELVALLNRRLRKTVVLTNANSYGLLASVAAPAPVVSISSSLGVEAQALGHQPIFLGGAPSLRLLAGDFECHGTDDPLGHRALAPEFWRSALALEHSPLPPSAFTLGDHYLRDSLEAWAFAALRNGLQLQPCHKTIVAGGDLSAHDLANLASILEGNDGTTRANVHVHMRRPPLRTGETVRLRPSDADTRHHFAAGFHAPESWGVWGDGPRSSIVTPVEHDDPAASRHVSMRLKLQIDDGLCREAPVLTLSSRGHPLAFVCFRPGGTRSPEVLVNVPVQDNQAELDLTLSRARSPSEDGQPDQRSLGIGLIDLTVHLAHGPIDAGHLFLWCVTDEPVALEQEIGA